MATIKELAEEFLPYPCPMWYAGDDDGYEESKKDVDKKRHIFEEGANAVLEEIEAILEPIIESTYEGVLDEDDRYYDENITEIYNKIKELKGK